MRDRFGARDTRRQARLHCRVVAAAFSPARGRRRCRPRFNGTLPTSAARAVMAGVLFFGAAAHAATVEGSVSVDGRPAVHAVVYLEGPDAPPLQALPAHVVMDQKNLAFVPAVLPVARGTVIEFTNSDDVQHNVFSPSAIAGKFNLGTYGPGAMRRIVLSEPGDVLVLCNIHMEMEAHILVLDGAYFSTVAQDGRYRIPDVPAGTYRVKIWQAHWLPSTQTVDLPATGSLTVNIATPR
jgi:plastocyanin